MHCVCVVNDCSKEHQINKDRLLSSNIDCTVSYHRHHQIVHHQHRWFIILFILLAFVKECLTLRIIKFDVPSAKPNGSSAVLHCDYDLENSELYSVKFYKDYVEFYRFLPKEDFPKQSFNMDGVHLDTAKSNATHVILDWTDLNSDGLYGCEVSTEGPIFATRKNEKLMKIYVLPDETLTIKGSCDYYRIDEQVNFECVSGKAWPQLKLNWFINDSPAPIDYLIRSKPTIEPNGLMQSRLGLSFRPGRHLFMQQDDTLRLRCSASLMFVYELKTVEYLIDGSRQNKPFSTAQINSNELPLITGIRDKYNVNDLVHLNCSTTASSAQQLSWFINGKLVNASQLIHYQKNHNGELIVGIRFQMDKKYFQTEQIELQCTAYCIKMIADFQEQFIIKTFNTEYLLSQSSGCSGSSSSATRITCLYFCYHSLSLILSIFLALLFTVF